MGQGARQKKSTHRRWHPLASLGICLPLILGCVSALLFVPPAWQRHQDDSTYGYPRTYQTDANVGHGDARYPISHFIALNLKGLIEVIEIPQGDEGKLSPHLYLIARLSQQGADLVPVTVSFEDENGDGKPDMRVFFNNTVWIWYNDGHTFQPKL